MFDVIIVGGGPAGLTAALYTARAGLSTLILEKAALGGQAFLTYRIDNYPGFRDASGAQLAAGWEEHVRASGASIVMEEAVGMDLRGERKVISTRSGRYEANAVILALGSERKKLGIPGEAEFSGRGVSYCATCDGNFFRNKNVAVIGGGNTAAGYAAGLGEICRQVTVIHHGEALSAGYALQKQLRGRKNVTVLYHREAERILGEETVSRLEMKNLRTGAQESLPVDGAFVAIGMKPKSDILEKSLLAPGGFIQAAEDGTTSIPGVFAAGDLRKKKLYQIVTAMADGANAAYAAQMHLQSQEEN